MITITVILTISIYQHLYLADKYSNSNKLNKQQ